MPKLTLSAVAQSAVIDQRTNSLSILNIIQEVSAQSFPTGLQLVEYVCMFDKEENDPEKVEGYQFSVYNNDEEIISIPLSIDFQGKARTRFIVNINGLNVKAPGKLIFQLGKGKQVIKEQIIPVSLRSTAKIETS